MRCFACGEELAEDSVFCPFCGEKIEYKPEISSEETAEDKPEKVCTHCGEKLNEDSVFCPNCGTKVEEYPEPTLPAVKTCSHCGTEIPVETELCPGCGNKLDENGTALGRTCGNCGHPMSVSANFCEKCGTKFEIPKAADTVPSFPVEPANEKALVFDRGYKNPSDDPNIVNGVLTLSKPYIFLFNYPIVSFDTIVNVGYQLFSLRTPVLFIAPEIEPSVLEALSDYARQNSCVWAYVDAPGVSDRLQLMLDDIAIYTGGELLTQYTDARTISPAELGIADEVVITRERIRIKKEHVDEDEILKRCRLINEQSERTASEYDKEKCAERISMLLHGIGRSAADFSQNRVFPRVCPKCGTEVPEGNTFCAQCGGHFVDFVELCDNCGAELQRGVELCTVCGKPIPPRESPPQLAWKYCFRCGSKADLQSMICTECGFSLSPQNDLQENHQKNICPQCGAEAPDGNAYCTQCGYNFNVSSEVTPPEPIQQTKKCPECGAEVPEGNRFCTVCGYDTASSPTIENGDDNSTVTKYNVNLCDVGKNQLQVIAAIRKETGFGLAEAKALYQKVIRTAYAQTIVSCDTQAQAKAIQSRFAAVGAKVTISEVKVRREVKPEKEIVPGKACPQCGAEVPEGNRFCAQCGYNFCVASAVPPIQGQVGGSPLDNTGKNFVNKTGGFLKKQLKKRGYMLSAGDKERIEQAEAELIRKFAAGELVRVCVGSILNTDWMVSPQGPKDALQRNITVEPERISIQWRQLDDVKVTRNGGTYWEKHYVTKKNVNFGFATSGYKEFKGYISDIVFDDATGEKVEINGSRMCSLFAKVLYEQLKKELPQCSFGNINGASFMYFLPKPQYSKGF